MSVGIRKNSPNLRAGCYEKVIKSFQRRGAENAKSVFVGWALPTNRFFRSHHGGRCPPYQANARHSRWKGKKEKLAWAIQINVGWVSVCLRNPPGIAEQFIECLLGVVTIHPNLRAGCYVKVIKSFQRRECEVITCRYHLPPLITRGAYTPCG